MYPPNKIFEVRLYYYFLAQTTFLFMLQNCYDFWNVDIIPATINSIINIY